MKCGILHGSLLTQLELYITALETVYNIKMDSTEGEARRAWAKRRQPYAKETTPGGKAGGSEAADKSKNAVKTDVLKPHCL